MSARQKLLRFLVIGAINTALDFGLLFALTHLGLPLIAANTISTAVALSFSFAANKKFTFKAPKSRSGAMTIVKFFGVTLFGLWVLQPLVILALLPLATQLLTANASLFVCKLIATGFSLVWNYVLYDRVVFRTKGSA